jgi:hypothetical protein
LLAATLTSRARNRLANDHASRVGMSSLLVAVTALRLALWNWEDWTAQRTSRRRNVDSIGTIAHGKTKTFR